MIFELKLFNAPLVLLLLAVLIAMHAAAVFTKGKISVIIGYVNIGLHLLLFVPMLNAKFHIEEAVLVYLISLFAYTLLSLAEYETAKKKAAAEAAAADPGGIGEAGGAAEPCAPEKSCNAGECADGLASDTAAEPAAADCGEVSDDDAGCDPAEAKEGEV